jgi:hypothetical protein
MTNRFGSRQAPQALSLPLRRQALVLARLTGPLCSTKSPSLWPPLQLGFEICILLSACTSLLTDKHATVTTAVAVTGPPLSSRQLLRQHQISCRQLQTSWTCLTPQRYPRLFSPRRRSFRHSSYRRSQQRLQAQRVQCLYLCVSVRVQSAYLLMPLISMPARVEWRASLSSAADNTQQWCAMAAADGPSSIGSSMFASIAEEVETRVDPADGEEYTRQEFIEHYGGTAEWELASSEAPAHVLSPIVRPAAALSAVPSLVMGGVATPEPTPSAEPSRAEPSRSVGAYIFDEILPTPTRAGAESAINSAPAQSAGPSIFDMPMPQATAGGQPSTAGAELAQPLEATSGGAASIFDEIMPAATPPPAAAAAAAVEPSIFDMPMPQAATTVASGTGSADLLGLPPVGAAPQPGGAAGLDMFGTSGLGVDSDELIGGMAGMAVVRPTRGMRAASMPESSAPVGSRYPGGATSPVSTVCQHVLFACTF